MKRKFAGLIRPPECGRIQAVDAQEFAVVNKASYPAGKKVVVIDPKNRIAVDEARHEILIDGTELYLAPKEFRVFMLLKNAGKTLSRRDIINEIWGAKGKHYDDRVIDQHIARVRKKITSRGIRGADVIKTQNSFGYVYKHI